MQVFTRARLQRALLPVALAALVLVPGQTPALAGDGSKKLKPALDKLTGLEKEAPLPADDARRTEVAEAIDATAKQNDVDGVRALLGALVMGFQNPSAEMFVTDTSRAALASMSAPEARAEVRGQIEKKKADPRLAIQLATVVAGWNEPASATTLAVLLTQKEERLVIAGAKALQTLNRRECIEPLIAALASLTESGGEPLEAVGKALQAISGQTTIRAAEDWTKWFQTVPAAWDPQKKPAAGAPAAGGTVTRFNPDSANMFETMEIRSKKVVIILDVSGSMHIKNYVREQSEPPPPPPKPPVGEGTTSRDAPKTTEAPPPGGAGTPPGGAPPAGGAGTPPANGGTSLAGPPLPPGVDPDKPGYKPKPCGFAQCPGARGHGTCPSDDNLPAWFNRLERLKRQVEKAIKMFKPSVRFNIVTFSTDAKQWQKTLQAADEKGKRSALEFLKAQRADGFTNALKAIDMAFAVEDADTFIFVTDGAPTNAAGRPYDQVRYRELLDEVKRLNKVRQVKIDVITMAEGHTNFAKGLAQESGGQYIQVP